MASLRLKAKSGSTHQQRKGKGTTQELQWLWPNASLDSLAHALRAPSANTSGIGGETSFLSPKHDCLGLSLLQAFLSRRSMQLGSQNTSKRENMFKKSTLRR